MKALAGARQWNWLTPEDRAHLDRWLKKTSDSVWDELAAAITSSSKCPRGGEPLSLVVHQAILARRSAEDSRTINPERSRNAGKRRRAQLQELATKMKDLVRAYRACKAAHQTGGAPPPDADLEIYEDPIVAARKQSLDWLDKDAERLRELATNEQKIDPYMVDDFFGVRASRQNRGSQRSDTRAIGVFVQHFEFFMREFIGEPRHAAIATLTNIAFPSAHVGEEEVRFYCRPTDRAGRRKKAVHSNVKDGKTRR